MQNFDIVLTLPLISEYSLPASLALLRILTFIYFRWFFALLLEAFKDIVFFLQLRSSGHAWRPICKAGFELNNNMMPNVHIISMSQVFVEVASSH